MPEAYDLRFWFWSGVARAEEGVTLFLKIIAGDCSNDRSSNEKSGCGVGGLTGLPGTFGFMDSLFNRRASVGLIVLAPSPLT